jgi:ribosomal protein S4
LIIRKKLQKSILYTDKKVENMTKWLKSDEKNNSVEMLSIPESAELEQFIKTHLIIEFYSR